MNMTKAAFQAWSLVCRDGRGTSALVLFSAVDDPDAKQVLLTFSVAPDAARHAGSHRRHARVVTVERASA